MKPDDPLLLALQSAFMAGILAGMEIANVGLERMLQGLELESSTVQHAIDQATKDYAVLAADSIGGGPVLSDLAYMRAEQIIERAKAIMRDAQGTD